jgi:hypothetical protein
MSKKYLTAEPAAIITNDIFLASFLHCVGCTLDRVERNDRRRVSFVFIGDRVRELREAYRTGKVSLDVKLFRESMNMIRDRMDKALALPFGFGTTPEQRSVPRVSSKFSSTTRTANLQTIPHY